MPAIVLIANCGACLAAIPISMLGQAVPTLAPMLEEVVPTVVNIATEGFVEQSAHPFFSDPFFSQFLEMPQRRSRRKTQSLGSGVIVDAGNGLVLTNAHVIENAQKITVNLLDGREFKAEVVGSDPETDIAVIKIASDDLIGINLAESNDLRVGDFVIAIGNPFGLGQTVTSGIVSALGRSGLGVTGYEDLIQTDASINPGNSGGALVNLNGRLVGLNTAIYSGTGGNIGIGFAIPIDMVKQVMSQLVEFGEVTRGFIGVEYQNLTRELSQAFGLDQYLEGVVLVEVLDDSPAGKAGLEVGDVITRINNKRIKNAIQFDNEIAMNRAGAEVDISYLRRGRQKSISLLIGTNEALDNKASLKNERFSNTTVGEIPRESDLYDKVSGVMIYSLKKGSRTWSSGLREGDIIVSVNRYASPSIDTFVNLLARFKGPLRLKVYRGYRSGFITVP
ncbi:MAG: Do family serine endopeptidase [Proteobacteria bacterium]|nr:Do family serine endopeptidase [Pseudomonadota bacterium]